MSYSVLCWGGVEATDREVLWGREDEQCCCWVEKEVVGVRVRRRVMARWSHRVGGKADAMVVCACLSKSKTEVKVEDRSEIVEV